jgi:hypothetical protein
MHRMVGNVLRILLHGEPPPDIASAKEYVDEALSIAMLAMRAAIAIHSTLGSSLGSLTFNRDIFLNSLTGNGCHHSHFYYGAGNN